MIKGLKLFGIGSIRSKTFIAPMKIDTLTDEDKEKSVDDINLIKEKLDGTIKFRMCVNGSIKVDI